MILEDDGDRRCEGLREDILIIMLTQVKRLQEWGSRLHFCNSKLLNPALVSVARQHHPSSDLLDSLPRQSLNHFPISELAFIASYNVTEGWIGNDPERVNYKVIHNQSHHQMFNLSHRTPIPAIPSDVRLYRIGRARYGSSFVRRS